MNNKKFLLVGDGRYSNRGCEAIVRGTVEVLSRVFTDSKFILSPFGAHIEEDAESETDNRIEHRIPSKHIISRFSKQIGRASCRERV